MDYKSAKPGSWEGRKVRAYWLPMTFDVVARVTDPVDFRPDPDPANQNFKTGSRIRILLLKKAHFSCPAYFLHGL